MTTTLQAPETIAEEQYELELGEQARIAAETASGAVGGKPDQFGQSFLRLLGRFAPYRLALVVATVLSFGSVALMVWGPRVFGRATDALFSGFLSMQLPAGITQEQAVAGLRADGQYRLADLVAAMEHLVPGAGIDLERLRALLIAALAIIVGSALLRWAQAYLLNVVIMRVLWRLREEIEAKINRLPLSYFDQVQRGELISRLTNDVDNIATTLQQALANVVLQVLSVLVVLSMMIQLSWHLALVTLITLPVLAAVLGVIGPKSQAAFATQWRKVGRLNARVEESFSGHALVKTFSRRAEFQDQFRADNAQLYDASYQAQFLSGLMMPAMAFAGNLQFLVVAVAGALMVAGGSITLGGVQAFIQYAQMFTSPLAELGGMVGAIQSGVASAERVFDLLDAPEQTPDSLGTQPVSGPGTIVFDEVRFSYDRNEPLIQNLSFSVRPGQTAAIVGPTGAGKTTLVNLLMRFYDLDGGRILVAGQNIADLTRHEVRERTGMVLQDTWLFAGTIRENIRYGRPEASDEEVLAAARASFVDRFVHSLPEGYDTVLEEDAANLSAGERQLLTIARAFLAQPDILILDEATSSVDTRTEKLVQQAMANLRSGRTAFVIAHRLSTIRDADLILVMDQGAIVEQGTHRELLAAQGAYARLSAAQFAGAIAS